MVERVSTSTSVNLTLSLTCGKSRSGASSKTPEIDNPAALPGYTLAPEASLTQTNELRSAFDWLDVKGVEHSIAGPIIVTGWSAGGHLTAILLDIQERSC